MNKSVYQRPRAEQTLDDVGEFLKDFDSTLASTSTRSVKRKLELHNESDDDEAWHPEDESCTSDTDDDKDGREGGKEGFSTPTKKNDCNSDKKETPRTGSGRRHIKWNKMDTQILKTKFKNFIEGGPRPSKLTFFS